MPARTVDLDDKYVLQSGTIYISGSQALVRLPMMQLARETFSRRRPNTFSTGGQRRLGRDVHVGHAAGRGDR